MQSVLDSIVVVELTEALAWRARTAQCCSAIWAPM